MLIIKDILKKHNITREDLLRSNWQVKILYLLENAIGEAIVTCEETEMPLSYVWQEVQKQFAEIKEEIKSQPEAWDELPKS